MSVQYAREEREAAARLIRLGLDEDLGERGDQTCQALIDAAQAGRVLIRCRQPGVLAGLPCAQQVFETLDPSVRFHPLAEDGHLQEPGSVVAELSGSLRSLLTGERTALNFLTHLSGVATLTRRFVDHVAATRCVILDTRKTLPGYRVLQKYAVRCGGGTNHRMGLHDGILIKDNHLAAWARDRADPSVAAAVRQAAAFASGHPELSVEVEVDSLEQLRDALRGEPAIVLLDNMSLEELREAVRLRNATAPGVQLEASGGITLETVEPIAASGVDRISIGALTHSAIALDLAFDWGESNAN